MLVSPEVRVFLASPHRYADLARLWFRFVRRELFPAFQRLGVRLEVNMFCDGSTDGFIAPDFPDAAFSTPGPGRRDFMEFYDAALSLPCDFLFFADADVFFLDGNWVASYFAAFRDPNVAAISFIPRKGRPAIFALLGRADAFRSLPEPVFACRYELPDLWPNGVNLQPAEFAVRELTKRDMRIINVPAEESSIYIGMFRSTTGLRTTREQVTQASGQEAFYNFLAKNPPCIAAAYDNILLGTLFEQIFREPFAVNQSGVPLSGSVTVSELRAALGAISDRGSSKSLLRNSATLIVLFVRWQLMRVSNSLCQS